MGNKPVRIGLAVDDKVYEAGSLMTGRVYLNISGQQPFRADSVQLALIGEELAIISHEESDYNNDGHHGRDHRSSRREVERASSSVVHMDVPLSHFPNGAVAPGQYEYPFEWELPSNLPGTMHCPKGESHCEINYKLVAYLNDASSSYQPQHHSDTVLCITAESPPLQTSTQLSLESEEFRISSCCLNQGSIWLGWEVDQTIASPGSSVQVGIRGMNQSKVEVQTLRARWTETVTWTAHGRTEEVTRTLIESKVPATSLMDWQSRDRHRASHYAALNGQQGYALANLVLPPDSRDSYQGRLIQTRHCLTVTAITPGACCITSPESSMLVRVQRKPQHTAMASPVPSAPPASYMEDETAAPTMVTADLLPENWSPQEAPVVTLPLSSAVVLDSYTPPPTVSAPDESMLKESHVMANSLEQLEMALSQSYHPLDTLHEQLTNSLMVTTVQNLTPPEFVQVCKCCRRQVPQVARILAGTMGEQFQCRHVLACLWAFPIDEQRLEVMHQVVPLASDLDTQRGMVERELTPNELLHFRAALK